MKKLNILILCFYIISCGKQTAPPLNLQDSEKEDPIEKITRAVLPEAPEPKFSSIEKVINDVPEPEEKPVVSQEIKDELKEAFPNGNMILREDYQKSFKKKVPKSSKNNKSNKDAIKNL